MPDAAPMQDSGQAVTETDTVAALPVVTFQWELGLARVRRQKFQPGCRPHLKMPAAGTQRERQRLDNHFQTMRRMRRGAGVSPGERNVPQTKAPCCRGGYALGFQRRCWVCRRPGDPHSPSSWDPGLHMKEKAVAVSCLARIMKEPSSSTVPTHKKTPQENVQIRDKAGIPITNQLWTEN